MFTKVSLRLEGKYKHMKAQPELGLSPTPLAGARFPDAIRP